MNGQQQQIHEGRHYTLLVKSTGGECFDINSNNVDKNKL